MKDRILSRYTSADLRYDNATHTTTLPDGRDVPHVTKILAETGVATDFESVMLISRRHRGAVEDRRELGTIVHAACHYFDDDDLEWTTLDPRVEPYVRAWQTCRQNLGLVPVHRERAVFHAADEYTGILDGIFEFTPGLLTKRILIDVKIGNPANAGCRYQTAAYAAAYLSEHPDEDLHDRWGLQLLPDRQVPYSISTYGKFWRDDYRAFQSFLTTYRSQQRTA